MDTNNFTQSSLILLDPDEEWNELTQFGNNKMSIKERHRGPRLFKCRIGKDMHSAPNKLISLKFFFGKSSKCRPRDFVF
jgi:hypothetical protein